MIYTFGPKNYLQIHIHIKIRRIQKDPHFAGPWTDPEESANNGIRKKEAKATEYLTCQIHWF